MLPTPPPDRRFSISTLPEENLPQIDKTPYEIHCLAIDALKGLLLVKGEKGIAIINLLKGAQKTVIPDCQDATCGTISESCIFLGYPNGKIEEWEQKDELLTRKSHFEEHTSAVLSLLCHAKQLIFGSGDYTICILSLKDNTTRVLKGHSGGVTSLAYNPKSQMLVSGSWDRTVRLWDLSKEVLTDTLRGASSKITSVAINKEHQIHALTHDGTCMIWDKSAGEQLIHFEKKWILTVGTDGLNLRVFSLLDGSIVKVWDNDKELLVFSTASPTLVGAPLSSGSPFAMKFALPTTPPSSPPRRIRLFSRP